MYTIARDCLSFTQRRVERETARPTQGGYCKLMNNTDWTVEQTVELFNRCATARENGESLTGAFEYMAKKTARSVNSVRNYYYGQAKTFELVPEAAKRLGIKSAAVRRDGFVPFEDGEVKTLVERVLTAKANGKSVRAAIYEMAGGDSKLALRYQNKYRSVLRSHRDLVETVMKELNYRGVEFWNPYGAQKKADNFARLTEYIAALDERRVGKFLSLIEKLT